MPPDPTLDREARLDAVLGDFFDAQRRGEPADRAALLRDHPDLADDLAAFFADEDRMARITGPLRDGPGDAARVATIPGYTIVREIARGGMGLVYEARQHRPGRRVALKVMRAGLFATPDDLRRFRNEAESAATLDHPNIVPIYEVGEHDGHPYFSMKLVEGGTLADRLADFRDDPRAAARLIATVARAVHHAHQRGILHRDLKPSNILLDAGATPFVADFGLAKRLGGDDLTQSGNVLGSPPYMAPEQAAPRPGGVTVATDVYGLGAILYATLTGRPPFRGETITETLNLVGTRDPEPPSRLNPRVTRDLEAVTLKSLEKEPTLRYPSAAALAEDLDRILAGEHVIARQPSRLEVLARWCRRNPMLATMGFATFLLSVTTLAVLTVSLIRIRDRERAARDEASRAVENLHVAIDAINAMLVRVSEELLSDVPRVQELRLGLVRSAVDALESLGRDFGEDESLRFHTAEANDRLAGLLHETGDQRGASAANERSIALLERLTTDFPEQPHYLRRLASALSNSSLLLDEGPEADQRLSRAITIQEGLARDHPETLENIRNAGMAHRQLAEKMEGRGQFTEAEAELRRALPYAARCVASRPDDGSTFLELGTQLDRLGGVLVRLGRLEEADSALRRAYELAGRAAELLRSPAELPNPAQVAIRGNYGFFLVQTGRPSQAEPILRGVVEDQRRLLDAFPRTLRHRLNLAVSLQSLGNSLEDVKRIEEALPFYHEVVELMEAAIQQTPDDARALSELGGALNNVAIIERDRGNLDEAERLVGRAIELQEAALSLRPHDPTFLEYRTNHDLVKRRIQEARGVAERGGKPEGN
jgi:tetratricopeptide (TPR) repeat protein